MPTVAVIGLGAFGLVTLKNLLEEGYDATGFEKSSYVGGLWHHTGANTISALQSTIVNVSRQRCCFTDFPFETGTSSYPTAAEVDRYLNDYADHFDLWPRCRLDTAVESVRKVSDGWKVVLRHAGEFHEELYDKLVCSNGVESIPIMPELENASIFEGRILHSRDYKGPEDFRSKGVLVVGLGNSAADAATTLVGVAKAVSLSHRNGRLMLPRFMPDGSCFDHSATYRTFIFRDVLEAVSPRLATVFIDKHVQATQNKIYKFQPEWAITPTPSLLHRLPLVSDTLVDELRSGNIRSVAGLKRVVSKNEVELSEGSIVVADAIIFCTGYHRDYGFLGPHDPSLVSPDSAIATPEHNYGTPRLYQNVLSLEYPDSLAFIGTAVTLFAAFLGADLSSMAVAQIWKDPSLLPSKSEMHAWYSNQLAWAADIRKTGTFIPNMTQFGPWMQWVEETAGTHVDEHLRYSSLAAWRFWWQDRRFSKLLLDGIYSPHVFRLFPSTKRKTWEGARSAIESVNEEVAEQKRERMKSQ